MTSVSNSFRSPPITNVILISPTFSPLTVKKLILHRLKQDQGGLASYNHKPLKIERMKDANRKFYFEYEKKKERVHISIFMGN